MDEIDTFDEDARKCKAKRIPLANYISDAGLKKINELFSDADAISRENYAQTNWHRLFLVICGVMITYFFINYGEVPNNFIISGSCAAVVGILIIIKVIFDRKKSHKKHMQYRVFAEALRAQFFVSYAGIDKNISQMLPWAIRKDLPWIPERISILPKAESTTPEAMVIFCEKQLEYHTDVVDSDSFFNRTYKFISNTALIITIICYFAAFGFDIYLSIAFPKGLDLNEIYFYFKMAIGVMTILTLLANNFFGKMSLNVREKEHERSKELYANEYIKILNNINDKEKSEEIFIKLIQEFLIENATWYIYESQNRLSFTI